MNGSKIKIDKFDQKNLQASSYDLTVGRVLGGIAKKGDKGTYYSIEPGGSAAILTAEKLMLNSEVAGHVNLMNRRAVQGMELLNPGHIDPGWGINTKGEPVGLELTAVIRNISNNPLELQLNESFLTIVFDKLETPTSKPYPPSEALFDPVQRDADLDVQAETIRQFVELQKRIKDALNTKMSYKDVLNSLALLTASIGLVITFVVAFVAGSATPVPLNIAGVMIDRSVLLFIFGVFLTIVIIVVSSKGKKTEA